MELSEGETSEQSMQGDCEAGDVVKTTAVQKLITNLFELVGAPAGGRAFVRAPPSLICPDPGGLTQTYITQITKDETLKSSSYGNISLLRIWTIFDSFFDESSFFHESHFNSRE